MTFVSCFCFAFPSSTMLFFCSVLLILNKCSFICNTFSLYIKHFNSILLGRGGEREMNRCRFLHFILDSFLEFCFHCNIFQMFLLSVRRSAARVVTAFVGTAEQVRPVIRQYSAFCRCMGIFFSVFAG